MDQAQQAVTVIWEMATRARGWIASVSDVLNPGSDPRKVHGARAVSITDLQRLLSESNSLPVSVAEADEVARIIHAALEWQRKVDELLSALQAPVRARAGRSSNCVQLSALCDVLEEAELIPVRLEQRFELEQRVQSEIQISELISRPKGPACSVCGTDLYQWTRFGVLSVVCYQSARLDVRQTLSTRNIEVLVSFFTLMLAWWSTSWLVKVLYWTKALICRLKVDPSSRT